eukprot:TRINITY_DN6787_c1_g1_i1.p1 TRINITY_DN6787_c1_g1~~TRINITY_DN6787_c1_g1_i1.p1  ORF type:complete len:467 (-),score=104.59 TRINITY_DN6787_c1_g1_i1:42-1442(-)
MVANTDAGASYSSPIAFAYIFNLIVGVGALALPIGFSDAGLILGAIFLAIMGFLAFVTVTWINEVQATANALLVLGETKIRSSGSERTSGTPSGEESLRLVANEELEMSPDLFEIKQRVEFGLLSEIFLGPIGQKIFYGILVIYLYGDLSIYAVAIPTSLQAVTGGWWIFTDRTVYYFYLAIFTICIVPFSFFNFQKTKYLQLFTIGTRNTALFTMIILAVIFISEGEGAHARDLRWFDFAGLPSLFGVSVYAFMCHHSLPSLITPIQNKKKLFPLLLGDFVGIYFVYTLLCVTALFAFGSIAHPACGNIPGPACHIQKLYTLNFSSYNFRPIAIFLTLFPLFTLSSNFPLISITLRNNLMLLIPLLENYPRLRPIIFGLAATMPPIGIAFATDNVDFLVNITGSYAGLGIMFVMPAFLLLYSRRYFQVEKSSCKVELKNQVENSGWKSGWNRIENRPSLKICWEI